MVMYLNRMLCVHFGLPLQYGGWREKRLADLQGWLSRVLFGLMRKRGYSNDRTRCPFSLGTLLHAEWDECSTFWKDYLSCHNRKVLLILGLGFDPRMWLGLKMLLTLILTA